MRISAKMRVLKDAGCLPPPVYQPTKALRWRFEILRDELHRSHWLTRNWSYSGKNARASAEHYTREAFRRIRLIREFAATIRSSHLDYQYFHEELRAEMSAARACSREVAAEWIATGRDPYGPRLGRHAHCCAMAYQDINRRLTYFALPARLVIKIRTRLQLRDMRRVIRQVGAVMLGEDVAAECE